MRHLKSPLLAQDIVQDVFMKLWFERRNIKANLPIEAWLFTVAKNGIINQMKKLANQWKAAGRSNEDDMSISSVLDKLIASENQQVLHEAVKQLPQQQRLVYQYVRQENLSYFQVAEKLEISPLTVKTHMARALKEIKNFLLKNSFAFFFLL
jgi:RNA polymerase sigma-70 factor (ECF subfamily)